MQFFKKFILLLSVFVATTAYADHRSLLGLKGNVESVLSESGGCKFDRKGNLTMYNASCCWLSICLNECLPIEDGFQGDSYVNVDGDRGTCEAVVYYEKGRVTSCFAGDYGCGFMFEYDSKGLPSETFVEQRGLMGLTNSSSMTFSNYKLDKAGNWIQRTVVEVHPDGRKKTFVEKRTVKYY